MGESVLKTRRENMRLLAYDLAIETGIPAEEILGRCRKGQITAVRHRLWTMLYDGGLSMLEVAEVAGVDHTSVLYAMRKHLGERYDETVRRQRSQRAA